MKKHFFIALYAILTSSFALAQSWESMTGHDGVGRHHPITVANDQYGYVIAGQANNGNNLSDVHRYEFATDTWIQLNDFPGGERGYAYGVNEGNDAYLGFGSNTNGYPTDWWHLDMSTGSWTELAPFPGAGRDHPALVWVANKVVMAMGSNGSGNQGDTWIYDIETDTWAEGASFNGGDRHHPFYFGIDGIAYIGMGHGNSVLGSLTIYNDWYAYDPVNNVWTQQASFPGEARVAGTQFAIGGKGYVLSGDGDDHGPLDYGEFWEYDPDTDQWIELTPHPGGARWAPGTFLSGCYVYLTGGLEGGTNILLNDLVRFSINPDCGCADETAFNFQPDVFFDDGTCCYNDGCTDPSALNFNEEACFDDGSCMEIILGCTDPNSELFDPLANTQIATGGPLDENELGPGGFHYNDSWDMVFDVSDEVLLTSLDVLSENNGTFVLYILDGNGLEVYQSSKSVSSGWNTLELNIELPAGTNYNIGVSGNTNDLGLFRNNAVPSGAFPVAVSDRISITGNTTDSPQDYFYYFYSWVIEAPCGVPLNIDQTTKSFVNWYPNPARDRLWINGPEQTYQVTILDLNGKLAWQSENTLQGPQSLDLSSIPSGVYTLGIGTYDQLQRYKLIIQ